MLELVLVRHSQSEEVLPTAVLCGDHSLHR